MENWEIKPNIGLGSLLFGMTREEVALYDTVYGTDPAVKQYGHSADSLLADLGDFAGFFSEDILEGAQDAAREFDAETADLVEETRMEHCYVAFEYEREKLSSISIRNDCAQLNFDGDQVFPMPSQALLIKLQRLNRGAKVHNDDVLFEQLGLMLTGFYTQSETGAWRFFQDGRGPSSERFVTLFAPSRLNSYLTDAFLNVDFTTR